MKPSLHITPNQARKIGSRQALISVLLGLLIANLIMMRFGSLSEGFIKAFFWFTDASILLNILVGVGLMLGFGHFFGQQAGKLILLRNWNQFVVGPITGLLILFASVFLVSWVGFFQEGLNHMGSFWNPFYDYVLKPVIGVMYFGAIPVLFVGLWFGYRIRTKGKALLTKLEE